MADKPDKEQKTEKPTPRRKKEARRQGQIARSPELAGWVILLAASYLLPSTVGQLHESLSEMMRRFTEVAQRPEPQAAVEALGFGLSSSLSAILPLLGFVTAVGLATTLAQVGFVFTGSALVPKATRVNPLAGLKRLFSVKALWETAKSVAKFAVVTAVAVPTVIGVARDLVAGPPFELKVMLAYAAEAALSLIRLVSFVALVIAFADYAYQRRQTTKAIMMTKVELKQELKNTEGDPLVKGKIRALQRAASRNRMLAALGDANVVIMNPTHVAVALRYQPHEGAPRVVAKGQGHLALRIRDRAQQHEVPVVEAPPLARALYKACELDQPIPFRLFDAVAKVLAFVQRLNGRVSLTGVFVVPGIKVEEPAAR